MKLDKLQKKIFIVLLLLCLITPAGILLPVFFNAGDAWGEWSAQTVKDLIGYVPQGLAKYSDVWEAPLPDYTINSQDTSVVHQSGYYFVSGLIGATVTYVVMFLISRLIVRRGK
ncbi:MAG: PDGLE domain-containing protein [Bacteroidales bacterium]|nr:PDGLE domain-containing protein [Bacteroidales bacterium]